jgi:uncharacterized membrane protein
MAKGKQPATEQYDEPAIPGFDFDDADDDGDDDPVTLEDLYDAVAELRGLVLVLAEPVILRQQAKDAAQAKREAAADAKHAFPSTVLGYVKLLAFDAPVVADACAPARQMVIDAMAATVQAATPAKTAVDAYRSMLPAGKRQMREHWLAHCDQLPDPMAPVAE